MAITFDIINIRPLIFYAGLKITCNHKKKIIKLSQSGYIEKLFDWHKKLKAKIAKILIKK